MKVMIVDTTTDGRVEVATSNRDVLILANIFEQSSVVISYHIEGMTAKNQQAMYGAQGFTKWGACIHQ